MTENKKLNGVNEVLNSLILNVKAKKGQFNKFGNYKYRSGEDILEAVKEELKNNDKYPLNTTLVSNPSLEQVAGRLFVKVITKLSVGNESIEAVGYAEHGQNKKGMDEAQLTGSTCTYAKKYSLQNLFQLDESEDDIDAKDNTKKEPKKEPAKNAFGLSPNGALANGDDMKETQIAANKDLVQRLITRIDGMGSEAELESWLEDKNVVSAYSKLEKYFLEGFNQVKKAELAMFGKLEEDGELEGSESDIY